MMLTEKNIHKSIRSLHCFIHIQTMLIWKYNWPFIEWLNNSFFQAVLMKNHPFSSALTAVFNLSVRCRNTMKLVGEKNTQSQCREDDVKHQNSCVQACLRHTTQNHSQRTESQTKNITTFQLDLFILLLLAVGSTSGHSDVWQTQKKTSRNKVLCMKLMSIT